MVLTDGKPCAVAPRIPQTGYAPLPHVLARRAAPAPSVASSQGQGVSSPLHRRPRGLAPWNPRQAFAPDTTPRGFPSPATLTKGVPALSTPDHPSAGWNPPMGRPHPLKPPPMNPARFLKPFPNRTPIGCRHRLAAMDWQAGALPICRALSLLGQSPSNPPRLAAGACND
jgi:hypothetical protein